MRRFALATLLLAALTAPLATSAAPPRQVSPLGEYRVVAKTEIEYLFFDDDRTDELDVTLAGRRVTVSAPEFDDASYTFRLNRPVRSRPGVQTFRFSSKRELDLSELSGEVEFAGRGRVQLTRSGVFKLSGTYQGEIVDGDFEGGEADGKFVGFKKSAQP